jgi:membrane-associated phospholipid phosphatase
MMAVILGALSFFVIVLAKIVHLGGMAQMLQVWPGFLIMAAGLYYCGWRPLPKLIDSSELAIWGVLLTGLLARLIQIAGRSSRPLKDQALAAIDGRVHFRTACIVHLFARLHPLGAALSIAYDLLPLLVIAAILLPPFCGHVNASRRYILSIVLAAIFTAALFALWPAAGPWTAQSFTPTNDQAAVTAYLILLKSHALVVADMNNGGIVSFPSFHVVLAILSAFALSSIRSLRAPVWGLAVLICISTVSTGWHYGIDVFGGVIVAIISISAVSLIAVSAKPLKNQRG